MRFPGCIDVDRKGVLRALSGGETLGENGVAARGEAACRRVEELACPRWVWKQFPLGENGRLAQAPGALAGRDIALHLAGCTGVVLLGLTLGQAVDQLLRAASVADVEQAVYLDTAASLLAEQYAAWAETLLREEVAGEGEHLTGRFSPGYGDYPLAAQHDILRLLDAQRAVGLTVSAGGALVPRKSVTAVLGRASQPVQGRLAGCDTCALRGNCDLYRKGASCGKFDF